MIALPEDTRQAQENASDPAVSAWVSANAGSGKTTVLVRRAIRLMMAGTPPARILCLTYTKAAAAHMANEVLRVLSAWVRLDDTALEKKLAEIDPAPVSDVRRVKARQLFAAALETPGGLKVQTIHAFCDRVLHQFPFEAWVPAGFEVMEEVGERDLLARARLSVLLEAASKRDGELGRALARAVAVASDQGLAAALDEAVRERRKLQRFFDHHGTNPKAAISAALGLAASQTLEALDREIVAGPNLPKSRWAKAAEALRSGTANDQKVAERLEAAISAATGDLIFRYLDVFLTGQGELRKAKSFITKAFRDSHPDLAKRLDDELARIEGLLDTRHAIAARERSAALLTLAGAVIGRYEKMKAGRGVLDFGDLVGKTADLLSDTAAAWVHYKLDGGIDHILIDEAQDTSPEQWTVIERLAEEFFAGRGAREDRTRTIFAVGDEKQSIFSFQGADPARFDEMRRKFIGRSESAKLKFHNEKLKLSFRSMPGVLTAIDTVFKRPEAHVGLSSSDPGKTVHEAIRKEAPALVELWPTLKPDPKDDEDGLAWDAPLDAQAETNPAVKLARQIAAAIAHWTGGGLAVTDRRTRKTRAARAGDIIVLVRRRGVLFEAILRALKDKGVPVAGADRLDLVEHIAVMDLMALVDALLLEHDDLSLACALKSPLFGLTDDDLMALAPGRTGSLAAALDEKAKTDARFKPAAGKLARWRAEARKLRPFDFLSRVLGRDRGRELILGRLGDEAADAIDELLARALAYEQTEAPTLAGFVAFLRRAGAEVKRDLEIESPAVRVMTVHGVKGLEAPIVVLADTTGIPADGRHDPRLLTLPVPGAPPGAPEAPVWALGRKLDSKNLGGARSAAHGKREEEYRRLLYVAVTRAADALVVCGYESERSKLPEGCWYQLVHDALKADMEEQDAPGFAGKVWRLKPTPPQSAEKQPAPALARIAEPAWLKRPAPPPTPLTQVIAPSRAMADAVFERSRSAPAAGLDPLRRGKLVHALLHALVPIPPSERSDRAKRFLADAADVTEVERGALVAEAIAVLDHADCTMLFGENSRGEVPIFARRLIESGPIEIAGRIDRLAETADAVHIADFKTDRERALPGDERFSAYVGQLALYREALRPLYPGKAVRAHLVWTVKPAIEEIPGDALDAAFQLAIRDLGAS